MLSAITLKLTSIVVLLSGTLSSLEFLKNLTRFYINLEPKGFVLMLGVRITSKVSIELPPKRETLVSEFNKRFSERSKITVGARAVSKHADRQKKNKFWGNVKGSEEERNVHSNKICLEIIASAAWISVFNLNKESKVIEIRNKEGYGLRWESQVNIKKIIFKGVIEPQLKKVAPEKKHKSSSESE